MTIISFIAITLSIVWRVGSSVAGVTYMDNFDFEERYRDVSHCDPFYWHPFHLPEDCADMYERLIRDRLPARGVKRTRKQHKSKHDKIWPPEPNYGTYHYKYDPLYQTIIEMQPEVSRELTPYEEMLESVQKDVNNLPSVASVQDLPNFGPIAVYKQPVSQISADMIKKVAMDYARSSDSKEEKSRERSRKSGRRWKGLLNKIRRRERKGWKKINNGEFVSFSKP